MSRGRSIREVECIKAATLGVSVRCLRQSELGREVKRVAARRGWWDLPVENGNLGRAEDVDVDVLSLEPNRTDLCGGNPAHRNVLDMLAHQADPSPLEHGAAASHLPLSLLPYSTMARAALKGGGRIPDGRTGAEPPPTRPPLAPLTRDFYAIFSTRLRPIFSVSGGKLRLSSGQLAQHEAANRKSSANKTS